MQIRRVDLASGQDAWANRKHQPAVPLTRRITVEQIITDKQERRCSASQPVQPPYVYQWPFQ